MCVVCKYCVALCVVCICVCIWCVLWSFNGHQSWPITFAEPVVKGSFFAHKMVCTFKYTFRSIHIYHVYWHSYYYSQWVKQLVQETWRWLIMRLAVLCWELHIYLSCLLVHWILLSVEHLVQDTWRWLAVWYIIWYCCSTLSHGWHLVKFALVTCRSCHVLHNTCREDVFNLNFYGSGKSS